MIQNEFQKDLSPNQSNETKVCDLRYLSEMMGGKNNLITGIIDTFLKQIPEELNMLNTAIEKKDYPVIKSFSHTMKSSVSIMGISTLAPILQEMQNLGAEGINIERIKELNKQLHSISNLAIEEIIKEKNNYA